ncbi:MAG: ATP-binding protein, partial [Candidatus Omnitrophica bacterium]|nr:ATP-binding protein [Candidatus Omnitrophota bacterium]
MNLFSLSSLMLFITCFALFLFIFIFGRNKVSRIWALFNLSISIWAVGLFFVGKATTESESVIYWRLAHIGGLFIAIFFYHTVCIFCNINPKKIILFAYLQAAIFLFLDLTTSFISSTRLIFGCLYYNKATLAYSTALVFWLFFMSLGHYELTKFYKNSTAINRNKIRYLFLGFFVGFLGGVTYFLPMYNINTFPIGNFTIPLYCLIATYAIFKHHVMDIEVVIKKTLVFAALLTIVFGIFVSITFLLQQLFMGGKLLGFAITSIIIILAYRPIENFLVNITDKYLFQKKYDYKHLIRQFMDELKTMILNTTDVAQSTIDFLNTSIHPVVSAIFMYNRFTSQYDLIASNDFKDKTLKIIANSEFIKALGDTGKIALIKSDDKLASSLESSQLKALGIELIIPLLIHKELIGLLCLGKKKSDEEYSSEDIEALSDLSGALSISLNNAQLFDERADAEKRALVGTIATGINHEVGNPLNIITIKLETFRILAKEGLLKNKTKEEIIDEVDKITKVCLESAQRIADITKQVSEFAKPDKKLVFDKVNISEAIDETIAFLKHGMILDSEKIEKRIICDPVYALADRGQLKQILFNLIKNSSHAIDKENGKIIVSVDKNNKDEIAIKIIDNGHGMSKEVMDKLFTPFFT